MRAQQAGVLLGYGEQTSNSGYQYKTMWIVFSPNEADLVATVQDVIVPRSTGFWRVGKAIVCEYDASTEQDSSRDVIWQTAIEKAPLIEQGPPCKSHRPGDVTDTGSGSSLSDSAGTHTFLCGREEAKLLFVSPAYVAEEFNKWDGCEVRGGHDTTQDYVRSLDPGPPIHLEEFFGERATGAYGMAARKGFAENSKEYGCPAPDPEKYDLKSWNIAHVRGIWLPVASLDEFVGECAFGYPTDLALPKSVTGEVPKTALWPSIASAVPHLSDFYLSPLGDYTLILVAPKYADYHLYAYSAKNGVLGKRLAEIPWDNYNSHPIVMAQWSSGKYVPQWTDAIKKIKDHALPDPVVRPVPPHER